MFIIFLEKISLITSEECIESNVIPVEAKKFLEEETAAETLNNAAINNEQDGEEEDLVCRISIYRNFIFIFYFFVLVRSYLKKKQLQ
jgi:hypothetical protein